MTETDNKNNADLYPERQIEPMEDRAFRFGDGKISGYLSCTLGVLSFIAVLCYQYPSYLTTAELRAAYDANFLQVVLKYSMYAALGFSFLTFCLGRFRRLAAIGVLFTIAAFAMGGYTVEVGPVEPSQLAFGFDWLKYRDQVILRPDWSLDLFYFCFNHLLITALLLTGNYFVATVFGWAANDVFQSLVQSLPVLIQVVILIVCADFVLYWSHRFFHEVPWLWKFHAVHHSVEHMDWMAGSRNHVVQMFVDRCLAMVPLYLLGTSKEALDLYVAFAAFQAVYVHANVNIPTGPLKFILATPQYHHWHHSSQAPAIDTNYSVHTPLFDRLFGTYHMPKKHWPSDYGTVKPLPKSFLGQFSYPFKKEDA